MESILSYHPSELKTFVSPPPPVCVPLCSQYLPVASFHAFGPPIPAVSSLVPVTVLCLGALTARTSASSVLASRWWEACDEQETKQNKLDNIIDSCRFYGKK